MRSLVNFCHVYLKFPPVIGRRESEPPGTKTQLVMTNVEKRRKDWWTRWSGEGFGITYVFCKPTGNMKKESRIGKVQNRKKSKANTKRKLEFSNASDNDTENEICK